MVEKASEFIVTVLQQKRENLHRENPHLKEKCTIV